MGEIKHTERFAEIERIFGDYFNCHLAPVMRDTQSYLNRKQVEEMADLSSAYDRNGLLIVGEEHFQQYISFKNIQVYEQCGDTFMDAVAVNEYPDTLVCALNIRFFDEDGTEIASGRVQTRDGQYVLRLENGDNTLFAQIDTDMTLTDKEFRLEYSEDLNVLPE